MLEKDHFSREKLTVCDKYFFDDGFVLLQKQRTPFKFWKFSRFRQICALSMVRVSFIDDLCQVSPTRLLHGFIWNVWTLWRASIWRKRVTRTSRRAIRQHDNPTDSRLTVRYGKFSIEVDACNKLVTCVLLLTKNDTKYLWPVRYWSKILKEADPWYNGTQEKRIKFLWSFFLLLSYIEQSQVTVPTDQQAIL